jgi:hypothetical protein
VTERTPAEKAAAKRVRLEAHVAKLTVAITDEINRLLGEAGVPRGTMEIHIYFDGALLQRLRVMVYADPEKVRSVGYIALREHIERAIVPLKESLPSWIEKHCHTKAAVDSPSGSYNATPDGKGFEGWVWNFYQQT